MDAESIQELRTRLAAQMSQEAERSPALARKLSQWLGKRSASLAPTLLCGGLDPVAPIHSERPGLRSRSDSGHPGTEEAPGGAAEVDCLTQATVALETPFAFLSDEMSEDFRPKRAAFGQRSALVRPADDRESRGAVEPLIAMGPIPAPAPSSHDVEFLLMAPRGPRIIETAETPFFPGDLADEPRRGSSRRILRLTPPEQQEPAPPGLAQAYLLANLAARLAHAQADLTERLAEVVVEAPRSAA